MPRTKRIILYYQVTPRKVIEPKPEALVRKEEWVKEVQKTVESPYKPKLIKVTYEEFNPEVDQSRKFFNGPIVLYYAIQNSDMFDGVPSRGELEKYRETILDEILGYNVELIGEKTTRKRKSTGDFKDVQEWNDFNETVRETLFDPSSYEFPNSEKFWEIAKEIGYEKAKTQAIKGLQERMKRKY